MANIGSTDIFIDVPSLPQDEFKEYSTRLFDEWEKKVESTLELSDYSLALEVEEGSIKAVGKIVTTLGVLYVGIAQYGSFISGLKTIQSQARSVGGFLAERASTPFIFSNAKLNVRRHGESLAKLQNLFFKVQSGELSVEKAMKESEIILGTEMEESPEFMNELKVSLESTPLLPQEVQLPLAGIEEVELIPKEKKRNHIQSPQPKKPIPEPEQFRVEVWRESKKAKKNVRVISL